MNETNARGHEPINLGNLTWHRTRDGYETETMEALDFRATATRTGPGNWHVSTYTWGLLLEGRPFPSLAKAKAWADEVYRTVNV